MSESLWTGGLWLVGVVTLTGLALAWPISGAIEQWLWNYEPKGDENGR